MNKENAKDYLPFVIALSEGKTIQIEGRDCLGIIYFDSDPELYRIKPGPMEFYAIANDDKTDILSFVYETKEEAEAYIDKKEFTHFKTVVHMREIE